MDIARALQSYLDRNPAERDVVERFERFLSSGVNVFHRTRPDGHFTASCWLVSPDRASVLLTHHRKLDRWLQLGGHADGDTDLARVAQREAEEESGIAGLAVLPDIFDLDAHTIPARGNEPEHTHWDVRFVVLAPSLGFQVSDESHALAWRPVIELIDAGDESIARMARRWRAHFVADQAALTARRAVEGVRRESDNKS